MSSITRTKSGKMIICSNCGQKRKRGAKGLCKSCWWRHRKNEKPCMIERCDMPCESRDHGMCDYHIRLFRKGLLTCKSEGCGNLQASKAKGLCIEHYNQKTMQVLICVVEGCGTKQKNLTHGLCNYHDTQRRNANKQCKGNDGACDRRVKAKGYCEQHYNISRQGGDVSVPLKRYYKDTDRCDVEGCGNAPIRNGVCNTHSYQYYRDQSPEEFRVKSQNNNHKRRIREEEAFKEDVNIHDLMRKFDSRCYYCKRVVHLDRHSDKLLYANIEHLLPVSSGGEHSYSNCVLSCRSCNSSKGPKSFWEFMLWLAEQEELGKLDYSSGRFREEPLNPNPGEEDHDQVHSSIELQVET